MESKNDISTYRDRLDATLASNELTNDERLKDLVKEQILHSSQEYVDEVVERRTKELSNFLDMLRSASIGDIDKLKASKESRGSWKMKHDNEEFRVMYREGPEGTPFHTLLVEGYVDGPVDVCACISWEAGLYPKWWPQSTIPSFKLTSAKCLQRIRIGERISIARMKLSWPLSAREAVAHYYELDYFQDELVVTLLNSISDKDSISKSTHGFDRDGIPDADDVVRVDVVGGFATQKVTENRSYIRVIANLDIKLDVVPPAFINFVARQLLGSGFRLYKKKVASVFRGDEDFARVLKDPQYERIRENLYSDSTPRKNSEADRVKQPGYTDIQEPKEKYNKDMEAEHGIDSDESIAKPHNEDARKTNNDQPVVVGKHPLENNDHLRVEDNEPQCEIEEIEEEDDEKSNQIREEVKVNEKRNVTIRPEVEKALNTLDKAIEIIRENKSNIEHDNVPDITSETANIEGGATKASLTSNSQKILQTGVVSKSLSKKECWETSNDPRSSSVSHSSRRSGSSSYARDVKHSKVVPASSDEYIQIPGETHQVFANSSLDQTTGSSMEKTIVEDNALNSIVKKNKKMRICCLHKIY